MPIEFEAKLASRSHPGYYAHLVASSFLTPTQADPNVVRTARVTYMANAHDRAHVTPVGLVTLHDVASEAGVSLATASRVLNGSARTVADSYRERVQNAAARLGYTANLSAQATARGSSAVVALLVGDIADQYFGQIASGVARGADEEGLLVTVAITNRDPERELRLVRALRGQRPRGLILAASRASRRIDSALAHEFERLSVAGGRAVLLGPVAGGARSVSVDDLGGAAAMASELVKRGYRDALVLAASEGAVTSDERLRGFVEGFVASGGALPRVFHGDFTRGSGAALMARALKDGVAPGTVVFGISDLVAIGALSAIRQAGRAVGTDIALAGFGDIPAASDVVPTLTTVRVPLRDVGYRALRAVLENEWQPGEALRLEVMLRESTPPRSW